jgi:hypothetical protein
MKNYYYLAYMYEGGEAQHRFGRICDQYVFVKYDKEQFIKLCVKMVEGKNNFFLDTSMATLHIYIIGDNSHSENLNLKDITTEKLKESVNNILSIDIKPLNFIDEVVYMCIDHDHGSQDSFDSVKITKGYYDFNIGWMLSISIYDLVKQGLISLKESAPFIHIASRDPYDGFENSIES